MTDIDPATYGSQQMLINAAGPLFPTNGRGGSQGSVAGGFPATGCYVAEGLTIRVLPTVTTDTVSIFAGDGTTAMCTILVPVAGWVIGQFIQIGGLYGYDTTPLRGISAGASNGTGQYTLWFRRTA